MLPTLEKLITEIFQLSLGPIVEIEVNTSLDVCLLSLFFAPGDPVWLSITGNGQVFQWQPFNVKDRPWLCCAPRFCWIDIMLLYAYWKP